MTIDEHALQNVGNGSSPESTASGTSGATGFWGIVVVLALTFAVYSPTLRYQFVHDDRGQIVDNPAVHSWRAVPTYFTGPVWAGVIPNQRENYYRPVFLLWLRINDAVFGNRAWGWHLTTILAHVLTTLLVYLTVRRLELGRDLAAVAALIFGLHPAHIEGVAWISGVTEPLLGVFLIASLLAYWQSLRTGTSALTWRIISLLLFAIAVLEKETALILPGLLVVYEWIFGADRRRLIKAGKFFEWCRIVIARLGPYLVVVGVYIPIRIHALHGFSHVMTKINTTQLVFTWPLLLAFWIRHLVWPVGLSTYYNFPAVLHPTLHNFVLPAVLDVGVAVTVYACVQRSRAAAFFAAWLVLPLVPLLNLRVFVSNDFAHDRYLYLPSVGIAVLVAMLLQKISWGYVRWLGMPASRLAVLSCLAAAMSYGTITESFYFKDNLTFYAYNLRKAPHNAVAESNYASILAENGEFGPAIAAFLDAVHYNPTRWTPTYNLALTYYKIGNLPEAEKYYVRAIQMNPNNSDEFFYLGMIRFKSGRTPDAIPCLRQAIALRPDGFVYHFALAMMLKTQGDLPGALEEFKQELANYPAEQSAATQRREIENQLTAQRDAEMLPRSAPRNSNRNAR